ncbi:MAG: DarT ssDNA thymidine ADP-ribosyltransferase family protein [Deinococcales bacterium]
MKCSEVKQLYYITHIDNVPSILQKGILSHAQIEANAVTHTTIYDQEIVSHRKDKPSPEGKSLWNYANVYFQPRNPMMYRLLHSDRSQSKADSLVIIGLRATLLELQQSFVSTGNAASSDSDMLPAHEGLHELDRQIIDSEWWQHDDGSKRKIMAECLIPDKIEPSFIDSIYVASDGMAEQLRLKLPQTRKDVAIVAEPNLFFRPQWQKRLGQHLRLIKGDMFFSAMQTLTISVNTVGIMGKGVASRAKYQFPDVYVKYQDACRAKKLTTSKPFLYKRESSIDEELFDIPPEHPNARKWFLLFATKKHWCENSKMEYLEQGLNWLEKNYRSEGISSLALPALGCGLGNLSWSEVGPLLCQRLEKLGIPIAIYLPLDQVIEPEMVDETFLLKN